ncbi:NERD domain-containing protein [Lysinibacillus yapensis]|uniref:NERD domain-containing protein n=1 Tax=Ureibacillus yapensis TaxID=2304605 RepID=A0A396SEM7_9BACL|nr:NERD domain-containing protein [Lysinibacillus yapensis]RHW36682.1 NERD domain-containing protein [Lysinibacillus yapensis]
MKSKLIDWENFYKEQTEIFEEMFNKFGVLIENNDYNKVLFETIFWGYKGFFSLAEFEYLFGYILSRNNVNAKTNCFSFDDLTKVKKCLESLLEAWEHSNNARKVKDTKNIKDHTKNALLASVTSDYVFQRGEKNLDLLRKTNIGIFSQLSREMKIYFGFNIEEAYLIMDYVFEKYKEAITDITNQLIKVTNGNKNLFLEKLPSIDKSAFLITIPQCSNETGLDSSVIEKFFEMYKLEIETIETSYNFKYPTDYNSFRENPIIKMSNGYILPCMTTLYYELAPKLTEALINNQATKDKFLKKRGDYLEEEVNNYFARVFPNSKLYNSLYYKVIEDGIEKRCELDHLIIYDTNVFIVESKSGKFSKPARRGAYNSFKQEVQESIEYAFKQAKRTKNYIFDNEIPIFTDENGTEITVNINKDLVINWFLINVTLENFGEVATNLSTLNDIGIYEYNEYPWSVNLNDLEKIYEYLKHPSQFIHYIYRRLQSNNSQTNKVLAFYELDFLYHYLNHNIYFEDEEKAIIFLETGGNEVLNNAITDKEDLSKYQQYMPLEILQVIEELENKRPLGYSEIILNIYELSKEGREDFINAFKKGIEDYKNVNKEIEIILESENLLSHIFIAEKKNFDTEKWKGLTHLRFYQARYKKMVCFIKYMDEDEEKLFNGFMILSEKEWREDPEIEMISAKLGNYKLKGISIK